jgi:methyltransferase OMS1, mitochondrial
VAQLHSDSSPEYISSPDRRSNSNFGDLLRGIMRFSANLPNIRFALVGYFSISSNCPLVNGGMVTSNEGLSHHGTTISACSLDRRDVMHRWATSIGAAMGIERLLLAPASCQALTPIEAESQYNSYASNYDQLDGGPASSFFGIDGARRQMIQEARGKVLEVGVGTGLNLDKYNADQISSLTLVDISDAMLQETNAKVGTLPNLRNVNVRIVKADMTSQLVDLFGQDSFDTVIDSFSMCVLGNDGAQRALDQLSRVVRTKENGSQLLLLENSRSSNPMLGLYQDATADMASSVGGKGCVYNQDIGRLIRSNTHLAIVDETEIATGLFRLFRVVRKD